MPKKHKNDSTSAPKLHSRNKHQGRYDFDLLIKTLPELAGFVQKNVRNEDTIDFANAEAVRALNKALLLSHYDLTYWDIPENYLCPPIPGRADYIHHVADLLRNNNFGKIPLGRDIRCLDIGTGANCIYPIIGVSEYGWSFVGSDIDSKAIASAKKIVSSNPSISPLISIREQSAKQHILKGIIQPSERFDLTICNPPFHASLEDARAGTLRKISNLEGKKAQKVELNFGGQGNELWCEGGERQFIDSLIRESQRFAKHCFWFTTLVSKQSNLKYIEETLKRLRSNQVVVIPMGQGNKTSRVVAWTFLSDQEQKAWKLTHWNKPVSVTE